MRIIRPRFSLRWLLIGFTVVTVLFYILFIRPTLVADRFVRAFQQGDFKLAASMFEGGDDSTFTTPYSDASGDAGSYPAQWSDIWHFRRRIYAGLYVTMKTRNDRTGKEDFKTIYEQTYRLESGPFRLRLLEKQGINIF